MNALDALLMDLIDYAGLYPPAALDMHTAVRNYLEYGRGPRKRALGRFVLDLDRFPYLWDAAGDYVRGMRLSVLAGAHSLIAPMHGFVNLATAAAVLHFGGDVAGAFEALEELEPGAWRITPSAIVWREHGWNADELCEMRRLFFTGFGSCSFDEPFHELEALEWL